MEAKKRVWKCAHSEAQCALHLPGGRKDGQEHGQSLLGSWLTSQDRRPGTSSAGKLSRRNQAAQWALLGCKGHVPTSSEVSLGPHDQVRPQGREHKSQVPGLQPSWTQCPHPEFSWETTRTWNAAKARRGRQGLLFHRDTAQPTPTSTSKALTPISVTKHDKAATLISVSSDSHFSAGPKFTLERKPEE